MATFFHRFLVTLDGWTEIGCFVSSVAIIAAKGCRQFPGQRGRFIACLAANAALLTLAGWLITVREAAFSTILCVAAVGVAWACYRQAKTGALRADKIKAEPASLE